MMKKLLLLSFVFLGLISCSKEKGEKAAAAKKDGNYTFVADSTKLTWTAFKFTERIGVSGTFTNIEITGTKEANTPFGVFENAAFTISSKTVDTNNPDRDGKLVTYFFNKLKSSEAITGSVTSINGDGSGEMKLSLNGKEKAVPFTLSQSGNAVLLESEIDLEKFLAHAAIESINTACKVLHTSADGVSKLWPDIKLRLRVVVK